MRRKLWGTYWNLIQIKKRKSEKNFRWLALYFVLYTLYFVFCTLYFILYILYLILCTLYFVLYTLYFILNTLYFILCTLYFVLYTLYFILYTLYFILYTLYFILYTLYFVLYTLYSSHNDKTNSCSVSYFYSADAKFESPHDGILPWPRVVAVLLPTFCDTNSKQATKVTVTSFQIHPCYFLRSYSLWLPEGVVH